MITLSPSESAIVTQSEFPPCHTLAANMSGEGIKSNLMSNLCFLVALMERSHHRFCPLNPEEINRVFGLSMQMVDKRFFDMTHVGKFRRDSRKAWNRAKITITLVFSILFERDMGFDEIFPSTYNGLYHSKLDELMTSLSITNSRMSHLCFLGELVQRCPFYPKSEVTADQLIDIIRACIFLEISTIDAVFISKFKNGHQLPWASARQLIARTMGIILGEEISKEALFPELNLYHQWGQYWPLHIEEQWEPTPTNASSKKVRVARHSATTTATTTTFNQLCLF